MQTGDVIKFLRKNFKMTQDELAEKLRLNKSSIQKYESVAVQNLKIETIRESCEIFKIAPWILIFPDRIESNEMMKSVSSYGSEYLIIRELNERGLEKLRDYAHDIMKIEEYRNGSETH